MKIIFRSALLLFLLLSGYAKAAIIDGTILNFEAASIDSLNSNVRPANGSGSWFAVNLAAPGDTPNFYYTGISANEGFVIGSTQPASGSHSGTPNGSESPSIDQPWTFLGSTGMHQTTSPINIISQSGNTVLLDFSGLEVVWNIDANYIPLNTAAWAGNPDGVAVLTCAFDCSGVGTVEQDEAFVLEYSATPQDGPFIGVQYMLHIESPNYVPVPAAIWMFIPGLLGLLGISYRRKQ